MLLNQTQFNDLNYIIILSDAFLENDVQFLLRN